ncbi:redoxin domain-containing protein [Bacteroidota bacterium]
MIFDDYSYLVAGDALPDIRITPIENSQLPELKKGHIVLLNFFIIPCKHCKHMLEYLQEEIWPGFQDSRRILLAIGRGHSPEELQEFRDGGNYIIPIAADPDRKIYEQFAEKKVPRNYLFDSFGRLIYQTRGFDLDQMSTLRTLLLDMDEE